jgi:hypothetical protein
LSEDHLGKIRGEPSKESAVRDPVDQRLRELRHALAV